MKNIHLIPTEKPSRLYKSKITQNISMGNVISQHGDATYNLNIYITSDEEIKEGDYGLDTFHKEIRKFRNKNFVSKYDKKIILTTDQDLIADGVQAIDDEFLEWFVKNPSCESVVVNFNYKKFRWSELNKSQCYKIIIPQEEPKQQTAFEASKIYYPESEWGTLESLVRRLAFIKGSEYQSERMYSEEDLLSAFEAGMMFIGEDKGSFREWFEQFKKK
jgi:hypothetical protein